MDEVRQVAMPQEVKEARFFRALGDATRLQLLQLLLDAPCTQVSRGHIFMVPTTCPDRTHSRILRVGPIAPWAAARADTCGHTRSAVGLDTSATRLPGQPRTVAIRVLGVRTLPPTFIYRVSAQAASRPALSTPSGD